MSQLLPAWQAELESQSQAPSLRRIVLASALIIGIGFGGFFAWAFTAQLDIAIPAMGSIVVQSKRKTVSILDPGILTELYVKEGNRIEEGQPLLRLDDTQLQTQLGSFQVQNFATKAKLVRLHAEQDGQRSFDWPAEILTAAAGNKTYADLVKNEAQAFKDRWGTYDATLDVEHKKIAQLEAQIASLTAQSSTTRERIDYSQKELANLKELVNRGLITQGRLFDAQRSEAELRGELSNIAGQQASARQAIAQTELEIVTATNQRQQDISKDMQDAQATIGDLAEKIRGVNDLIAKKLVTAPEAGVVTDIKLFTPGSSIGAGQPILDIVPQNDKLVIEVQVRPDDIEHVHPGERVNVRLTAYKQRRVPILTGQLIYVSADSQQDQQGNSFILARAELDRRELNRLKDVTLYPGMPAEVLIIGGERTAIDYFVSPITDSLRRSFGEE
jgi:HlyD family secretion protein